VYFLVVIVYCVIDVFCHVFLDTSTIAQFYRLFLYICPFNCFVFLAICSTWINL